MTRFASSLAVVLAAAGVVHASNCPVLSPTQLKCQNAVGKAGAKYAKSALGTIQKCLQAIQSAKITGDPATVCLGNPPTDPATAAGLLKAADKVAATLPKQCSNADTAALQLCAPTASGLASCLVADSRARIGAALDAAFGTVVANPDTGVQKCQQTIARESGKLLQSKLKASPGPGRARCSRCSPQAAPAATAAVARRSTSASATSRIRSLAISTS